MTSRDTAIMWLIGVFVALSFLNLANHLAQEAAVHPAEPIINACGTT